MTNCSIETADKTLCYRRSDKDLRVQAQSNSDWAADGTDSSTGYYTLNKKSTLVSWRGKSSQLFPYQLVMQSTSLWWEQHKNFFVLDKHV